MTMSDPPDDDNVAAVDAEWPPLPNLAHLRALIREGNYFFYVHALIEAKKDGVTPDDVIHVLLTGKVIEEYPERRRLLVYGEMITDLPLHVVCDVSNDDLVIIPTVYIPSDRLWINYRKRR
jgi:hypothetical protein